MKIIYDFTFYAVQKVNYDRLVAIIIDLFYTVDILKITGGVFMKKFTEILVNKTGALLSSLALSTALKTSNETCTFYTYQPKEPKELEKFKK